MPPPAPGSGTAPPGATCIPCTTGQLEVTVFLQTLCWDTDRTLGVNSPDRLFTGVMVVVNGPTDTPIKYTNGAGMATYDGLNPGSYSVRVSKPHFVDVTDSVNFTDENTKKQAEATATVAVHETTRVIRVMRRADRTTDYPEGLECKRKHSVVPPPSGQTGPSWLGPIFWESEPWILVLRDVLWLLLAAAAIITAIVGFKAASDPVAFLPGAICAAAICLAFWAYVGNVIFGQGFGIPAIIAAALAFIALLVLTIVAAAVSIPWMPKPDPFGFPLLAATWMGFSYGFLPGRRERYNPKDTLISALPIPKHPFIALLIGMAVALALCIILFVAVGLKLDGGRVVEVIIVVIAGGLLAGIAGLLGLCFANEGKTNIPFTVTDFLLPYAGERYCVQGHRGFISHYFRRTDDPAWMDYDEEPSYDFSLPEGARLLCCKEGHVVDYDDTQEGAARNTGNQQANYIAVRHRDDTVAKYLHLMKDGIIGTAWNKDLPGAVSHNNVENAFNPDHVDPNPLHVHPGQVLAGNGDVGISMFPHLHLWVMKKRPLPAQTTGVGPGDPAPDSHYLGYHYQHGRCYSMRKYQSTNVDKGLLVIPPDNPPFNPGGTPTDGTPVPDAPAAPAGPTPPEVPSPPIPPAPSAPPVPGSGTPPTPPADGVPPLPPTPGP